MNTQEQVTQLPTASKSRDLFTLAPRNLEEAMKYAEMISKTDMVPKDFKGNPGNVLVAVQMGSEVGLPPTQALQNIAVINGRPAIWGDAALALVSARNDCEDIHEECDGNVATCTIKRRGKSPVVRTFSMEDATKAGLANKQGPWTQYPKRMLQMRARSWAIRDCYPDALKGISIAEEAQDIPVEKNVTPAAEQPKIEHYPADKFEENFPAWQSFIQSGKKTAEDIIATVSSKGLLTEDQQQRIRECEALEGEIQ